MRDLDPALQASLSSGCTTLCRCIRITRADGHVLGFTDHDAILEVESTPFKPSDGFEASQESAALGPTTGEWDLKAALTDDRITQTDLLAGRYDGAAVDVFLVDWQQPAVFEKISSGTLGDVTSRDGVFQAEVRGPFTAFDRVRGRVFSARCDAELGDERCGVSLANASHRQSAAVTRVVEPHVLEFSSLSAVDAGQFDGGSLRLDDGTAIRIKSHQKDGGTTRIALWQSPPGEIAAGDQVTLTVGCDKSFTCCTQTFNNAINFRGFPYMPGDDFALSYPASNDGDLDGGSLTS